MNRVLNSWKEIASYVGRGVRTVQRWEKELKFPVRRPRGRSRSAVVAMSDEIDRWLTHATSRSEMDAATPKLNRAVWTSTRLRAQALVETAAGLQAVTRELQKSMRRTIELARRSGVQRQVFSRIHYALEPGGFLFLDKDEPKLTGSPILRPVNSQCRIFQRVDEEAMRVDVPAPILKLKPPNEAPESSNEALQSTSKELETINEELRSLNEELATSNDELRSSNKELETSNEVLQSVNEELENMIYELEVHTRGLDSVMEQYKKTVRRMPWPVALVGRDEKILLWNSAAQRLFGVGATRMTGVSVTQLPIQVALRKTVLRHLRTAMETRKSYTLRNHRLNTEDFTEAFDIEFTPIARDGKAVECVLVTFGPIQNSKSRDRAKNGARPNARGSASK